MATENRGSRGNLLLAALAVADRLKLTGGRPPLHLAFAQTLNQPGERIRHVYFPIDGFISLIAPGGGRSQLDDDPAVEKLRVTFLNPDDKALTVPHPQFPRVSICQEPSIVKLPDGRLFCVMRTMAESPFWTTSSDAGETWSPPQRLLMRDGGEPVLHPLSPSPMYDLAGDAAGSGRYALFVHNNDGHYAGFPPERADLNRRPVFLLVGKFADEAKQQPIEFEPLRLFMMHDDVPLGPPNGRGRLDMALYSSLTVDASGSILWYPDRKFFLLGRRLQ